MKNSALLSLMVLNFFIQSLCAFATYIVALEDVHCYNDKIYFTITMIDSLQIHNLDYKIDEIDDTLKTLSEYNYHRIKDTIVLTLDPEESYHSSEPVVVRVEYDPFHDLAFRWVRNPYGKADYCLNIKSVDVERVKYLRIKIDREQILTSVIKKD